MEEQAKLEEQLLQAQKMDAIGQLAGGVAHDFNNLLQVMLGYVHLIAGEIGRSNPIYKELREVARAGDRARVLVSQLLTFSRRQIMRPELLELNVLIADFLKMLQRVIGEHIQLEFMPGPTTGNIFADRGMIEQVLMNLCVNARDAIGGNGTLAVETSNAHIDEDVSSLSPDLKPGPYAVIAVIDTGCGMDEDTVSHIFEPFFTTKDRDKGTGLGLATVYGIVRQHEGAILVRSKPGQGTTFTVYLPQVDCPAPSSLNEAPERPIGGTESILLAEDDDMVRSLATQILQEAGYSVIPARNGAEAVALFRERPDSIDLLVFDIVMPIMGGRAAYDEIQRIKPGIPALFASGYAEDSLHSNFVLEKGMELIQKPYRPQGLLQRIRQVISGGPSSSSG
jgi:nitrogen-specific signal transduction histidine kinase